MSEPAQERPRPSVLAVLAALVLGFVVGNAFVNRGDVRGAEEALKENLKAVDAEDRAAMIASFHRDSPFAAQAGDLFDRLMPKLDVTADLVSFEPVGASGDLVVARYVQRTASDPAAPGREAFTDNEITGLAVFRLQDGKPRVWLTVPIEARALARPAAK